MSVIARCEYGKTCQLLVQLFNTAAQAYQDMISNMGTTKMDISIQEGKYQPQLYLNKRPAYSVCLCLVRKAFENVRLC